MKASVYCLKEEEPPGSGPTGDEVPGPKELGSALVLGWSDWRKVKETGRQVASRVRWAAAETKLGLRFPQGGPETTRDRGGERQQIGGKYEVVET